MTVICSPALSEYCTLTTAEPRSEPSEELAEHVGQLRLVPESDQIARSTSMKPLEGNISSKIVAPEEEVPRRSVEVSAIATEARHFGHAQAMNRGRGGYGGRGGWAGWAGDHSHRVGSWSEARAGVLEGDCSPSELDDDLDQDHHESPSLESRSSSPKDLTACDSECGYCGHCAY